MTSIPVDNLIFDFDPGVDAEPYDLWQHARSLQGKKALDVVAIEDSAKPSSVWLIEAKDFRIITHPPKPANLVGLPETVAQKVRDTLEGLQDASVSAVNAIERQHAGKALSAGAKRVVLHLEPHAIPLSTLFPRGYPAVVWQKLRQLVHVIDPNPLVLSIATTPSADVPWQVS